MTLKIVPITTTTTKTTTDKEEVESHLSSDDDSTIVDESPNRKLTPTASIKCLLIALVVIAVLSSVFLLTTIWISCFSTSVSSLSVSLMSEQFSKIISFTDSTIRDVIMVSENAKNTMWWDLKYENTDWINLTTYKIFKSSYQYLSTLMIDAYVGDPFGGNKGIIMMNGIPSILLVNSTGQFWTHCHDIGKHESCHTKSSQPDVQLPPFDMSYILGVASDRVNQPTFTLSYTDPTLPSITFMSLVNSKPARNVTNGSGLKFDWYFGFDISVATISNYLKKITDQIVGSLAFIIEIESEFIVASSYPEIPVAKWDDRGNQERKKATNFGVREVDSIGKFIYGRYHNKLDTLACGSFDFESFNDRYINVYRMCNSANVNWLFVFSVPQWNYLGTMIIAIVAALTSSTVIVTIGVLLGVVSSFKIVKPFYNLIDLFASVSNMDLDNITVVPSAFREVYQLQQHFKTMVAKIKQYRCFIPPHLLAQIDAEGNQEKTRGEDGEHFLEKSSAMEQKKINRHESTHSSLNSSNRKSSSRVGANSNYHTSSGHSSSLRPVSKSLFKLGLDKKKITVSAFYFVGLDVCMDNLSESELVIIMSDYFDAIQKVARLSLGQLGNFEKNSITISWNSTSEVPNHEEKGVAASYQILQKLEQVKETKWKKKEHLVKKDLFHYIDFRVSIMTQHCRCGNVGTHDIKTFSIVGSHLNNLDKLMNHGFKLDAKIVASEDTFLKCNHIHQMRLIGSKNISPLESSAQFFSKTTGNKKKIQLFEVGESNHVKEDEWMYELQQQSKKEKWKIYNTACALFQEQEYEEAIKYFELHLEAHKACNSNKDDLCAIYMIKKCLKKIQFGNKNNK